MIESKIKEFPKLWSKSFLFLMGMNLFVFLGFNMLMPTLPVYIKELGGSNFQASLVIGIFSISALIVRSFTGNATDKFGRKPLLIIGFCFLIVCNISYFWAAIMGIMILRFFHGIGWGITSTSIATVVSDIVPANRRGEGMGYYSLTSIFAGSVAPIVAIIIMNNGSFKLILTISTILLVIGVLLSKGVDIPAVSKRNIDSNKSKGFSMNSLFEKSALFPSFLCFLLAVTFCGIMSYIMLFGKEIGMTNIWIYYVGHVSMILITRPFIGKIFDKKGHAVVIIPGAISVIVGLIVLSYTTSVAGLVIASLFYGFGYGAVQPSLQALAVNRASLERKGAANGTFLSSLDLGFTVGSMLLSLIAQSKSFAVMYRVSSVFMILFLVVYGFSLIKEKNRKNNADILEEVAV